MQNSSESEQLRNLAGNLPGVVFCVTVSPEGSLSLTFVCEEAREILQMDPYEIEHNPSRLLELVLPEERKEIGELLYKVREAKQKISREISLRRRDGSTRNLWIEAIPRSLPNADVEEWFGVALDVTEAREGERKLRETYQLLNAIVSSVEDAIFVVGHHHRQVVKSANAAVEHIFGYKPEELEGRTTEILHEDHESFEEFGRRTEKVLETGKSYRGEYRMRRRNGEIFPTEHVITALEQEAGWQGGVVSVVRDITERKAAEEALRHSW